MPLTNGSTQPTIVQNHPTEQINQLVSIIRERDEQIRELTILMQMKDDDIAILKKDINIKTEHIQKLENDIKSLKEVGNNDQLLVLKIKRIQKIISE